VTFKNPGNWTNF